MFVDQQRRVVSQHDTWISLDPVFGCPYSCNYCVLRHSGGTGVRTLKVASPHDCVERLLSYKFFVPGLSPVAIGNETDMLHPSNVAYLLELLKEMAGVNIRNPLILITKAPLHGSILHQIRDLGNLTVVFFLSYSGLGSYHEPNFTDQQLRRNFGLVRSSGFPAVHYWRPLLPENTTSAKIRQMLEFVSLSADASVFIGLKLHPELSQIIGGSGGIVIPPELQKDTGEWLSLDTINRIYREAGEICPTYPLYRHSGCALAYALRSPNRVGTIYRADVCIPSHCPERQRDICKAAKGVPSEDQIETALRAVDTTLRFVRHHDRVVVFGEVTQEEFAYILQQLNCPLEVRAIKMQNLYHGDIYRGQRKTSA